MVDLVVQVTVATAALDGRIDAEDIEMVGNLGLFVVGTLAAGEEKVTDMASVELLETKNRTGLATPAETFARWVGVDKG